MGKNKPFKVLSASAMTAALALTALTPVASAAPVAQDLKLSGVVVEQDGKLVELSLLHYSIAYADGLNPELTYVKLEDKYYRSLDYALAYIDAEENDELALEKLAESNKEVALTPLAGTYKDGEIIYDEKPNVDGQVKSVKAINQTIAKGKEQELTFEVNGDTYTAKTFAEKFGEEGYTVKFLYNQKSSDEVKLNENGTVNVKAESTFKYSVQVTDKDGKVLPEDANNAKNFAEVTVKSDAVEKVTEAKLSNDLTYVTMNEKEVTFVATKGINGLGKEVLPGEDETTLDGVTFERAVSSDSTVAYVEDKKIVPLKEGNVTFDVYFTNVKEPVKVTVEVKAAQEATSMEKIENMKVQTGEVTLPTVKVLDQYGKAMEATPVIKVTDKDNKEVQVSQDNTVSLTEAGKYTVKVFASNEKDAKQLGSYTIETVKVDEKTTPEVYELNFIKDDKDKVQDTLDIEGTEQKVVIDVVGKVDGVKVATDKFHTGLEAKSSDDAVTAKYNNGKITVTFAKQKTPKVGDVTITLYNKEGAMVTDLQTATVKVVNTAAQIEELKLADEKATALTAVVDDAEALKSADNQDHFKATDIADQLTAGKDADEKEIFKAEMVKEVKFIERVLDEEKGKLTGKVHVTLDAKYGGKTFVFDAEVTTKTQLESAIITVEAKQEVSEDDAVANKQAEIANDQFKFTAAEGLKGTEGNDITIKFAELGDQKVETTSVSVEDKTITVTLAQSAKGDDEAAVTATVKQVVDAINKDEDAKALVKAEKATDEVSDEALVTETTELTTKDGVDEVKAEAAVDQQITFTFSEAVDLKAEDVIKIGETEATVASVKGNVVVVTVPADNAINADADADATITVKGEDEEFVALEGVNFGTIKVTAQDVEED